ncbi:unnamed protein product, partial [Rotaria magnacalcarata]
QEFYRKKACINGGVCNPPVLTANNGIETQRWCLNDGHRNVQSSITSINFGSTIQMSNRDWW